MDQKDRMLMRAHSALRSAHEVLEGILRDDDDAVLAASVVGDINGGELMLNETTTQNTDAQEGERRLTPFEQEERDLLQAKEDAVREIAKVSGLNRNQIRAAIERAARHPEERQRRESFVRVFPRRPTGDVIPMRVFNMESRRSQPSSPFRERGIIENKNDLRDRTPITSYRTSAAMPGWNENEAVASICYEYFLEYLFQCRLIAQARARRRQQEERARAVLAA